LEYIHKQRATRAGVVGAGGGEEAIARMAC